MNPFKNVDLSSVTYTNMKSNKPFLMIIGSILLIFVITLGYSIFKYMKNIINLKPYLINKPVKAFIHKEVSDTGEVSQKNPYRKVEDDVVKNTGWKGNNYSYSFWMKINDLEYNYGKLIILEDLQMLIKQELEKLVKIGLLIPHKKMLILILINFQKLI